MTHLILLDYFRTDDERGKARVIWWRGRVHGEGVKQRSSYALTSMDVSRGDAKWVNKPKEIFKGRAGRSPQANP